ncbi:MBG domain-containing protein, partial [Mucilaginibacter sp. BT774]|uniref:MBG domain-containing protein n=1 Tax=Mucilaginibacter sp. BT774 TaxID=3062276 RepID=UPI002676EC03
GALSRTSGEAVGSYPIGQGTVALGTNYTLSYIGTNFSIIPASLTITAKDVTKTYGAKLTEMTGSTAFTSTGLKNGEAIGSVTIDYGSGSSALDRAGSYPGAVYASAPIGGTFNANNYSISYNAGTITVNPAALTITADNKSRYFGFDNPPLTVTYSGFVNNENSSSLATQPSITTLATINSPVGTYTITASGAISPNYTINYKDGALMVNAVPITFNPIPGQVYGTADFDPGASSFNNLATVTYTSSNPAVATIVNGKIHIKAAGTTNIKAFNGSSTQYQLLTVASAPLTITVDNKSKNYGAALPALTVSYNGFVNGDGAASLTTQPTISTTATAASPVNTYPITASGAVNPNYTISYVAGTLTVNKVGLIITSDNKSKNYGAALPALTASYTGFVNGDNSSSLTTQPTISTTATAASPVNTYPITASGAVNPNYTISYVAGTLTVNKVGLTITADNKSKDYGAGLPVLTVSYTGFVNGDNSSSLTTQPTISTTGTLSSPVGNYSITASGAVNPNYSISYVPGTLSINKLAVCAAYNGVMFANTDVSLSSTHVNLSIVINAAGGADARTATVKFTTDNNGGPYTAVLDPSSTAALAIYNYSMLDDIGTNLSKTTLVAWTIDGNFLNSTACSEANTEVTVSSRTSDFLTGGGFVVMGAGGYPSAGTYAGAPNTKTNFGFNVKWNKTLTNIQGGGFNGTIRNGNFIYQISAPKVLTLTVIPATSNAPATAAFTSGNATINIFNATTGALISTVGNNNLTVEMTDNCEPGPGSNTSGDLIAITLTDSKGNLLYSNNWNAATNKTVKQSLGGGNLQVHSDANTAAPTCNSAKVLTMAEISNTRNDIASSLLKSEPVVKQAMSPNGDGINDVLIINNIEYYPDNRVILMNRSGAQIFDISGYDNVNKVFDGHSNINKAMQQPGSYFYLLEYKVEGVLKRKTGYFVIKY